MSEFHICENFGCCGTPRESARIEIDPEVPRYEVVAGPGVHTKEVSPGLSVVWLADDEEPTDE